MVLYGKWVSVECDLIVNMFGKDKGIDIERFKEFNERVNKDYCLGNLDSDRRRLTNEARVVMKRVIGAVGITGKVLVIHFYIDFPETILKENQMNLTI